MVQRSISHSPVGLGLASGFIDDDEAMNHEHAHLLTNLIGSVDMRIEVGAPFRLSRFDTLLMCSDGLTDNLSLPDIVNSVRVGPLTSGMGSLVAQCRKKMSTNSGHQDDLTIALYRRSH